MLKKIKDFFDRKLIWLSKSEINEIQNTPYVNEYYHEMKELHDDWNSKEYIENYYLEKILEYIRATLNKKVQFLIELEETKNNTKNLPQEALDEMQNNLHKLDQIYQENLDWFNLVRLEILASTGIEQEISFKNNISYRIKDINRPANKDLLDHLEIAMPDLWTRVNAIDIAFRLMNKMYGL